MDTGSFKPRIVGFLCNWCCYGGADLCGVSRFQYPPYIRVIRLMCSGRVDPAFVLRAFANGTDGVFIGGCHINDCHYNTEGNYDAYGMVQMLKKLLGHIGIDPERLRLEWVSAGEGIRFAEIMNEYGGTIKAFGPLGQKEGLTEVQLKSRIEALIKIIPYLKLVERERLRPAVRTEAGYHQYFTSDEFNQLFRELVVEKLALAQIMSLLRETPLPTVKIAEVLGMTPSEASGHMNNASKHGFVRYDVSQNAYTIA